ncbi:hypothetical protein BDN70DRAFT_270503 [Pholiota conissans]|uniref:Uncharacterized protein n=1 Tax=Pholiota conissans TaxID=109636 RepID=A0A9P5YV67_9AGAR|nr:hypothetical protein BDN70DRAFT_270503 [Pholiota conissans]
MSIKRQIVEKRALQILAGEDEEFPEMKRFVQNVDPEKPVRIPRLIWHDEDANVLWIEDLGKMRTLSEALFAKQSPDDNVDDVAAGLGAYLFEFYNVTSDPPSSFIAYMANLSDLSGIRQYLVNMVLTNLSGAGLEDATIFSERVRTALEESDTANLDRCLARECPSGF